MSRKQSRGLLSLLFDKYWKFFPWHKVAGDVKLATQPQLAHKFKISSAIPLLPLYSFMACTGTPSPLLYKWRKIISVMYLLKRLTSFGKNPTRTILSRNGRVNDRFNRSFSVMWIKSELFIIRTLGSFSTTFRSDWNINYHPLVSQESCIT